MVRLTQHKAYISVKQAYEKSCEVFLSIQNAVLSKLDTSYWRILHIGRTEI